MRQILLPTLLMITIIQVNHGAILDKPENYKENRISMKENLLDGDLPLVMRSLLLGENAQDPELFERIERKKQRFQESLDRWLERQGTPGCRDWKFTCQKERCHEYSEQMLQSCPLTCKRC